MNLKSVFHGDVSGYQSRSEAEMALMIKLVFYGFPRRQIWAIMRSAGIGRWQESSEHYRELTYGKAGQYVRGKR